jgi:hypothetical protein
MLFVFRKPIRYAVAGYGVFNWVKGGVIRRRSGTAAKVVSFLGSNHAILTAVSNYIPTFPITKQVNQPQKHSTARTRLSIVYT